jgi:uncharacterized glyoxalase superfamily protein PhnB
MFDSRSTLIPGHRYRDAAAAIEWLCQVLGFELHAMHESEDGKIVHAELTLGGGMIMLGSGKDDEFSRSFKPPNELGGIETRTVYVVVPDADEAHARAVAAEAPIVRPLRDTLYGSREFGVRDPEGHSWIVGTYDPWEEAEKD